MIINQIKIYDGWNKGDTTDLHLHHLYVVLRLKMCLFSGIEMSFTPYKEQLWNIQ